MSISSNPTEPQDASGDVNRENDNDEQHVEDNIFADPVEDEASEDVPLKQHQQQEDRQCCTPERDVLEMPTILTPMLRREQRIKEQANQSISKDQIEHPPPQVKTILRTSETFRASPILKNPSRDGVTAVEEGEAQRIEGYQDRSKSIDEEVPYQVQRPTPQKLFRRSAATAAANQEGYSHYPYPQQFAAPHEYYHHPYVSTRQDADESEGGSNSSSKQEEGRSPNIISPNNPYPTSHPGYNRYHQYSYSGPPPHHPYYGGDRPPPHRPPPEGSAPESYDASIASRGRGAPPPPGYWSTSHDRNHSPPRRAHSYESTSSSTGVHYSPMKAPPTISSVRESSPEGRMEGYESASLPGKSEPNVNNGGVWKPRVSEYPSPPRVSNSSWDYGEPPADFNPSTPYSGPPPPPPNFSPAAGGGGPGAHYNPGSYLPSPRGGWDIRSHPPQSPYQSFRYLGSSRSWDSEDYALIGGGSAFSKHGADNSRQHQLLLKSTSSPEQDGDDITEEEVQTHGESSTGSSNRRDQSFAPKYTYTFSGSFGASFDHEDPVLSGSGNTKPPIHTSMGPPPRTPAHSNAGPFPPPHYPPHPPPPDAWYYGGGGYAPPHHRDPYGGPPPVHYSPGRGGGMVNGRMMWGGPMPARGGPHHRLPDHMPNAGTHPLHYPKVTPPSTAVKKKVARGSLSSSHPHPSSSLTLAAQYAAAVEFTKARLQQLLVLTSPPGKNSGANAKDLPPVIVLPPTPNILVDEIRSNDVLLGRGGGTNTQAGNRRFRGIVNAHQPIYLAARRKEKPLIARCIVEWIRQQGGKFLKKDEVTSKHYDVGCERAEAKTSQALREGLDVRATKNATGSSTVKGSPATSAAGRPLVTSTTGSKEKNNSSGTTMSSVVHSESNIQSQEHMLPPEPRGWGGEVGYGQPPPGYYPPPRPNLYDSSRRIRSREEVPPYPGYPPHHHGYPPPYGAPPPSYYGAPGDGRSPKRIKWAITPANDHKPPLSYPPVPNVLSDEDKILFKEFSPPPPSSASDKSAVALVAPSYDQGESTDL